MSLINGGQYYPDRTYMGNLIREGKKLSDKPHAQWKGFVVSNPKSSAPPTAPAATIIDMDAPGNLKPAYYKNVLQSFMLFDERGHIRVQNSYNLSGRAAIGEDKEGRLFLIMTPAAISIYDLAVVLQSPSLGLKKAMSLDGGFEAQLLLWEQDLPFLSTGQFTISDNKAIYLPGYHPSLPSVLAVERRPGAKPPVPVVTLPPDPNPGQSDPNPEQSDPNPEQSDPNPGQSDPNPEQSDPNLEQSPRPTDANVSGPNK